MCECRLDIKMNKAVTLQSTKSLYIHTCKCVAEQNLINNSVVLKSRKDGVLCGIFCAV